MMPDTQVQNMLVHIEQQCAAVASAVLMGQAAAVEVHSTSLRDSAISLADFLSDADMDESIRIAMTKQLRDVSQTLSVARAGLARQNAVVERALNAVVPSSHNMTYGADIKPYGSPVRQSGNLRTYAA